MKDALDELTQNKMLVRASIERVWGQRKIDELDQYVTVDFVDHGAPPGSPPGAAGFVEGVNRILAAFPDVVNRIDDIVAEGDRVAVRWTMSGTNTGDGLGFPATGRAIRFSGITLTRIVGGRIAEHWSYRDDLAMLRQLGFIQ